MGQHLVPMWVGLPNKNTLGLHDLTGPTECKISDKGEHGNRSSDADGMSLFFL